MTRVSDCVVVCGVGLESSAATVKVKFPRDPGLPEITPELGCIVRPEGSDPVARLQVYGGVPPLASIPSR